MIKEWADRLNKDGHVAITESYYDRIVNVLKHKDGKYIVEDSNLDSSNDGVYMSNAIIPIGFSFIDQVDGLMEDDTYFNPQTGRYEDSAPLPEGFQYEEAVHVYKLYHFTSVGCPNLIPFKSEVLCIAKVLINGTYRYRINQHVVGKCPFKMCD